MLEVPARVPVLVVGAGPGGLALATDLGQRGISCLLVERAREHSPLPKMNHVNPRSMELCRRWGLAEKVRHAGWPEDYPLDVAYLTSLAGHEIARFEFPSQESRPAPTYGPEPSQRCPQIWFDPILEEGLGRFEDVQRLRGHELLGFEDEGDGILARVRNLETELVHEIRAEFLVGADGANSLVRKEAGIERENMGPAPYQVAISLRAKNFWGFHDKRRAAFYWVLDENGARGVLTPTDGDGLWRFNWNLRPDESLDDFDLAAAILALAGTGFDHEIIKVMPWQIRFTLAKRYRQGRVFLAGDAARTLSPTGGLGMNTGLADAADLGWKLAAYLQGWAGDILLDSYDAERRATGRRINEESLRNLVRVAGLPRLAGIAAAGDDGNAQREQARQILMQGDFRLEWMNDGVALGARYEESPVIAGDGSPPSYDPNHYVPSAAPGGRAPHAWLSDGRSTLDLFGPSFCLLRLGDGPPDAGPLEAAARQLGLPSVTHRVESREVADLFESALVLVRPDGYVAWRGDALPADPGELLDHVRGAPRKSTSGDRVPIYVRAPD